MYVSCSVGCQLNGLICTRQGLYDNNVDSSAEMLSLIAEVGSTTKATSCSYKYGFNKNVPNWNGHQCFISNSSRDLSTFDCHIAVNGWNKHRLCYCHSTSINLQDSKILQNLKKKEELHFGGVNWNNFRPDGCRKTGVSHSELREFKTLLLKWADIRGKICKYVAVMSRYSK